MPTARPPAPAATPPRCVAWLLAQEIGRAHVTLQTVAGLLPCTHLPDGRVCVDMGAPKLGWADVPLARAMDTLALDMPGRPAALSMGNPHVTFFVPDIAAIDIVRQGPAVEHDPLFPDRVNVGFAQILSPTRLRLRVWGTRRRPDARLRFRRLRRPGQRKPRRGLTTLEAQLDLDGGTLSIAWRPADDHVLMTGPVATIFRGET